MTKQTKFRKEIEYVPIREAGVGSITLTILGSLVCIPVMVTASFMYFIDGGGAGIIGAIVLGISMLMLLVGRLLSYKTTYVKVK